MIAAAATSVTAFIGMSETGPLNIATHIADIAAYIATFGGLSAASEVGFGVMQFFANGGTNCYMVRVSRMTAQTFALAAIPQFNLLCMPGVFDPAVLAAAALYCGTRRAFLIADADPRATTQPFVPPLPNPESIAIYAPWLQIPDPLRSGATRTVAPSGSVAGLYARTDAERGVWHAPAGTAARLLGVTRPVCDLADAAGCNVIRAFPSAGVVVWRARTMAGPSSDYKYIPVRRLMLFIEQSITEGIRWAVTEPNAEPLWSRVRLNVGAFLQQLYQAGALVGTLPNQAWFVKCDATTMTTDDIGRGVLNVLVGFAPLRPAEFAILKIQQMVAAGG